MSRALLFVSMIACAGVSEAQSRRRDRTPAKDTGRAPARLVLPYPHPMISEVLFDPPGGSEGDASGDGKRQPTGDEFVEIVNPHDKPISIGGYTISDRNYPGRAGFFFRFPPLRLGPGETAVVFNGLDSGIRGNFGNARRPSSPSAEFHGAWVFHAGNEEESIGLANGGDWVMLSTPREEPIHCVWWGEFDEPLPDRPWLRPERAPGDVSGSIVRITDPIDPDEGPFWRAHPERNGLRYSVGETFELSDRDLPDEAGDGPEGGTTGGAGDGPKWPTTNDSEEDG